LSPFSSSEQLPPIGNFSLIPSPLASAHPWFLEESESSRDTKEEVIAYNIRSIKLPESGEMFLSSLWKNLVPLYGSKHRGQKSHFLNTQNQSLVDVAAGK
jgi:hypothetical protein